MSSINPNNIDSTYPIAGQDNDSQGFRDNFTNIKNNLTFAKTEIEDLANKVVLKSALAGTSLNNDMNNQILEAAQLLRTTQTFDDLGAQSGTVAISWSDGHFQRLDTSGSVSLSFADWPTSGFYTTLRVLVNVTNVAHTITLPAAATIGTDSIAGIDANLEITAANVGSQMFEVSTFDNGTNLIVVPLVQAE